ncbi:MAG TPA: hypothetical protein VKH81_17665 [Candidatus Angelobacter sp.]|nr:hypothetical protein [Candidatus Angelobacter sp.]
MARTLRPLSLSQLLDETFNIYRRNFLLFLGISAIPNVALLLVQLGLTESGITAKVTVSAAWLAAFIAWVASLFVDATVTAATTFAVSDIYMDVPTSMAASFSRVAGKAFKVVYVSFITSLIVAIGFFLCIAPGVYWGGKYGLAVPAAVLEPITGNQSLKRSGELTTDSVGRVILIFFLTSIFAGIMTFALREGLTLLPPVTSHGSPVFSQKNLHDAISALGSILFDPITAIALTLAYYDQRVRREAFDIEHMMSLLNAPEVASGASPS